MGGDGDGVVWEVVGMVGGMRGCCCSWTWLCVEVAIN